jgi:acylphosphatase
MQMDEELLARGGPLRLTATIFGRVQGVSFRYYTLIEARRLGIAGWVQNEPGGTVRVLAEGPRADLEKLLDFLRHGPRGARVERVEEAWSPANLKFDSFEVRYG